MLITSALISAPRPAPGYSLPHPTPLLEENLAAPVSGAVEEGSAVLPMPLIITQPRPETAWLGVDVGA